MDNGLVATLISAAFAGIGVTVAKDTKVSEFRQQWIDNLRTDVAEFMTVSVQLIDELHGIIPRETDDVDSLVKLHERVDVLRYRILLRLDLKDKTKKPEHFALSTALAKVQAVVARDDEPKSETIEGVKAVAMNEVLLSTAKLLDEAWTRVKRGELRYRLVLWGACIVLIGCAGEWGFQTYSNWIHPEKMVSHFTIDSPVKVEEKVVPAQTFPQSSQPQGVRNPSTEAGKP